VLHLLKKVDDKHRSAVTGKLIVEPARRQELLKMLGSSGSLEYTRSRVGQLVAKAIGVLNELEKSSAKAALLKPAESRFCRRRCRSHARYTYSGMLR